MSEIIRKLSGNALLIMIVIVLSACGGFDQDPLKGESDRIRNAVKDDKPQHKPAIPRNALQIDIEPRVANFIEGREGKLLITGRVFNIKADHEVVIEKDDLPEGASFDPATGEFLWTPPYETVSGESFHNIIEMKVRLFAHGKKPVAIERVIPLNVRVPSDEAPEIVSSKLVNNGFLIEGGSGNIEVVVRDRSAIDGLVPHDKGPSFSIIPIYDDERNAASFVRNPSLNRGAKRNTNDPSLWTFNLKVNLKSRDIISRNRKMGFGLIVYSRFGVPSAIKQIEFDVKNRVVEPELSWAGYSDEEVIFIAGEKFRFNFKAFDRRKEAKVTVENIQRACTNNLSPNAICKCTQPTFSSVDTGVSCYIEWKPEESDVGTKLIYLSATSTNKEDNSDVQSDRFTRTVKIVSPNKK